MLRRDSSHGLCDPQSDDLSTRPYLGSCGNFFWGGLCTDKPVEPIIQQVFNFENLLEKYKQINSSCLLLVLLFTLTSRLN